MTSGGGGSGGHPPQLSAGPGSSTCTLQHLTEAIAKIHRQKQCPSVVRIVRAVRQALQYDIDADEVIRQLEAGAAVGVLLRVENNGVVSYKEASKQTSAQQPAMASSGVTSKVTNSSRSSAEPPAKKVSRREYVIFENVINQASQHILFSSIKI